MSSLKAKEGGGWGRLPLNLLSEVGGFQVAPTLSLRICGNGTSTSSQHATSGSISRGKLFVHDSNYSLTYILVNLLIKNALEQTCKLSTSPFCIFCISENKYIYIKKRVHCFRHTKGKKKKRIALHN